MTRSRSVLCSKIFAGSSLIIAMIGVSACSSTPGARSLAVSAPSYMPMRTAYNTVATDATVAPTRTADAGQADFMPVGGSTPAPAGFLDLCQRSPVDCQHSDNYNPDKIRALARTATIEHYRLAFAALRQNSQGDASADLQSASVSQPADNAPAATTDGAHYLTWPAQDADRNNGQGAATPLSYVQPLQLDATPGLRPLPGLVAPAANGYISDFLDLSVNPGGWTQLGAAAPAARPIAPLSTSDVQPGAISPESDGSATLNWSHKSDDQATVVQVSAESTHAPSIQYDIPNEPYDWAHVHVPAPAQPAANSSVQASVQAGNAQTGNTQTGNAQTGNAQNRADDQRSDYLRIDLNARNSNILRQANDEVNRIMRGATDWEVYHVADYWNAPPLVRGVRGDCEDFALEKRRLLIENGIPPAALSIAVVRTRLGEDHAVLIVSTLQGDYVLDNLQYDIRAWRKAGYTWIARQGPGDDLGWVSLAPANNRNRSSWQAATVRVAYSQ